MLSLFFMPVHWTFHFLAPPSEHCSRALIILNQNFSAKLFRVVWEVCQWRCCADGGANRLYDLFEKGESWASDHHRNLYIPDMIKGDLDSIRPDVKEYYASEGVPIIRDGDQDSTDLMKCLVALSDKEILEKNGQYEVILLGGLSGRLDQTIHTLSILHKLRKSRNRMFAITDESVACVLDEGEHFLHIDHSVFGETCGLLPVGTDAATISTEGLKWNLTNQQSSFDGLISTSNHLVPEEEVVWISTSKPICWTMELDITRLI